MLLGILTFQQPEWKLFLELSTVFGQLTIFMSLINLSTNVIGC